VTGKLEKLKIEVLAGRKFLLNLTVQSCRLGILATHPKTCQNHFMCLKWRDKLGINTPLRAISEPLNVMASFWVCRQNAQAAALDSEIEQEFYARQKPLS